MKIANFTAKKLRVKRANQISDYVEWKSIDVLSKRLRDWTKNNTGQNMTVLSNFSDFVIPSGAAIDIVLFSDGAIRLKEVRHILKKLDCRYWVLSEYSKKLLQLNSRLNSRSIRVIPRAELFRPTNQFIKLNKSEPINIIFSGRTDEPQKNFQLVCQVVSQIQLIMSQKIMFHICGPHLDPIQIKLATAPLKWKNKPIILGDLGTNWTKKFKIKNPILINLSTFIGEDFGVSVAQAQEAGGPIIISNWGGHTDIISSRQVVKIPVRMIKNKGTHRQFKSEILVNYIVNHLRKWFR